MIDVTSNVVEIVPDKLYALGGAVRDTDKVSWVPSGRSGMLSINCYLLTTGDGALLIDTGPDCLGEPIVLGIKQLIGTSTPLSVFLTRAEGDCIGNLAAIVKATGVQSVHSGGTQNPFDFLDDALDFMMDQASDDDIVHAISGRSVERRPDGHRMEIGADRFVQVRAAPLRILQTYWLYDEDTRTLFTSDFFTHNLIPEGSRSRVTTRLSEAGGDWEEEVRTARDHMCTKFEWMRIADRALVRQRFLNVMESVRVENIAPTHGSIVMGEEAVKAQTELVLAALDTS